MREYLLNSAVFTEEFPKSKEIETFPLTISNEKFSSIISSIKNLSIENQENLKTPKDPGIKRLKQNIDNMEIKIQETTNDEDDAFFEEEKLLKNENSKEEQENTLSTSSFTKFVQTYSGKNLYQADRMGWSFIHFAAIRNNVEVLNALLNKKVNINLRTKDGKTPLWLAIENENIQAVQFLLSKNARIDAVDIYGEKMQDIFSKIKNLYLKKIIENYTKDYAGLIKAQSYFKYK